MSSEQACARRNQARPEPRDGNGRGHAPQHGTRRSYRVGDSLEQKADVGNGAAGTAQAIGIDAHDPLNGVICGRFRQPQTIDARDQVVKRFQQRK